MHLALVISSLGRGGAERVMSVLASYWAMHAHRVSLITLGPPAGDAYPLAPGVARLGLDLLGRPPNPLRGALNNVRRWRALRTAVVTLGPDVVISFVAETNILTLAACAGLPVPALVSERVDPRRHRISVWQRPLRQHLYPRARAVVVQTEVVRSWMATHIPRARVRVIPNPALVPRDDAGGPQWQPEGGRWIIGMGRLTHQKGFDLLLRAFARCAGAHPEWLLAILGEGEERPRLEALAAELGITPRVRLPGAVPRPAEILRRADLFVLSSRFEGFPNALLEAMACGVAPVAANCPSGPADIIEDGCNGLLVEPERMEAIEGALVRLMGDEATRRSLAGRAAEVGRRFSLERVAALWDELLEESA